MTMPMQDLDFCFRDIVESAKDVILVTKAYPLDEPGPEIVYVNKAFTELTGYSPDEVIGKNPRILQSHGTDDEQKRLIRQALDKKEPVRVAIKNYSKTGTEYWLDLSILPLRNPEGVVTHFAAIQRDVTEHVRLQHELEELSNLDPLTGLLNRRAFDEVAKNEISRFKRSGEVFSLLMIDIDHFKSINDKHGHAVGDAVIEEIANLCQKKMRPHDKVARLGGEEFCVFLPCTRKEAAFKVAERLREMISNLSIPAGTESVSVTVSAGVSESKGKDSSFEDVLKRADERLYKAKSAGRNRVIM